MYSCLFLDVRLFGNVFSHVPQKNCTKELEVVFMKYFYYFIFDFLYAEKIKIKLLGNIFELKNLTENCVN